MKKNHKKVILLSLLLLLFITVPVALAAEFRAADNVVIAEGEVIDDDLILSGNTIEMNGTVKGDLIAMASNVTVNGTVEGSVFAGGQSVVINGDVMGSVYGGAYLMEVGNQAKIGRNLYVGGYAITTKTGSTIGRSIYASGNQLVVGGTVADDVVFNGIALVINGSVGGDVDGTAASPDSAGFTPPPFVPGMDTIPLVSPGLTIGADAGIGGQVNVAETAPTTETTSDRVINTGRARLGEFLALILVGALLIRLWPAFLQGAYDALTARLFPSTGWGCLVLILAPLFLFIGIILVFVTGLIVGGILTLGYLVSQIAIWGGTAVAFAAASFMVLTLTISKIVVASFGGKRLQGRFSTNDNPNRYWALIIGAFIYEILAAIPFVGPVITFIVILTGLGAIFLMASNRNVRSASKPS
jgi:hypothetical protein